VKGYAPETEMSTMSRRAVVSPPTFRHFRQACRQFQRNEDPVYRVATAYVKTCWGKPKDVADGISVLLLIWNKAFYNRFGSLNFRRLAIALQQNAEIISQLRGRSISSYQPNRDARPVARLFQLLLEPLAAGGRRTPVGVAKALHLLAPRFLPLWDGRIARRYRCVWSNKKSAVLRYLEFLEKIQTICNHVVRDYADTNGIGMHLAASRVEEECSFNEKRRTLVKLVDEYNYVTFVRPFLSL
jgi:hypothetical protein